MLIPKDDFDLERPKVRPICLLAEIGEVFERIIVEKMKNHPEATLNPNKFAFCRQRSTVDAIIELREFIEFAHKEGGVLISIGLDIVNAFNSLQWADICEAMKQKNFPTYLQRIYTITYLLRL